MGRRVAARLQDVGRPVVVWNRTRSAAEQLARRGTVVAKDPADAAARASRVIVTVSDPDALRSVSDDLFAGARAGAQIIVMSTVGPDAVMTFAAAAPAGIDIVDAPVLGSLAEVEQGRLTIFAGTSLDALARVSPLLNQLGRLIHVGDVGAGSAAKLVANHALLGVLTVLGETVAFADDLDLARRVTYDVLAATPLAEQMERRRPVLDGQPFATRYRLTLARKDTDLMLASGAAGPATRRLLPALRSWLLEAEERGRGDQDYLALLATILDGRRLSC